MRPKVVLAILLVAAGVLAVAIMLSNVFRPQPAVAPAQVLPADVAQRKAHVVIVASPTSAQIYIDDAAAGKLTA